MAREARPRHDVNQRTPSFDVTRYECPPDRVRRRPEEVGDAIGFDVTTRCAHDARLHGPDPRYARGPAHPCRGTACTHDGPADRHRATGRPTHRSHRKAPGPPHLARRTTCDPARRPWRATRRTARGSRNTTRRDRKSTRLNSSHTVNIVCRLML